MAKDFDDDTEEETTAKSRRAPRRSAEDVEALVLSGLAQERYLPPALLEQAQRLAARTGASLDLVLAQALAAGLRALEG